jgi:hypothetical protein
LNLSVFDIKKSCIEFCEPEDEPESRGAIIGGLYALFQEIKEFVPTWKIYYESAMSCKLANKYLVNQMYYFLRQNLFDAKNIIEISGHTEDTGALNWIAGHPFSSPLGIQELLLDLKYGTNFPDFFDTTIPVMSQRLLNFLAGLGVHNFDSYEVILNDKYKKYGGFSAINVLGCIDGVSLGESEYRLRFNKPCFTGTVVIDENKINGARFFRLLYGPSFIVVSQDIADALMEQEWSALMLQPTVDYKGV